MKYDDEYFKNMYFKALTNTLKQKIIKKYKSVKKFSDKSGIPYMTISNVLKRGIGNSSFATVLKICQAADIPMIELFDESRNSVPEEIAEFMEKFYGKD